MTRYFRMRLFKFALYSAIIFLSFIIQSTPGVLDFFGIKPNLVLPACICIAIFEGEFIGGLFGFFAGIFCDTAAETIFGFNAFFYLVLCITAGLVMIYILSNDTMNALLLCFGGLFLSSFFDFFFSYVLYQYEGLAGFFYTVIIPPVLLSSIFSLPYYYLFYWLHGKFETDSVN